MGVIQNAINQTIGLVAVAKKLNKDEKPAKKSAEKPAKELSYEEQIKQRVKSEKAIEENFSRQEDAMQKVAQKQEAQLKQKEIFKKYPKNLRKTIELLQGRDI